MPNSSITIYIIVFKILKIILIPKTHSPSANCECISIGFSSNKFITFTFDSKINGNYVSVTDDGSKPAREIYKGTLLEI